MWMDISTHIGAGEQECGERQDQEAETDGVLELILTGTGIINLEVNFVLLSFKQRFFV